MALGTAFWGLIFLIHWNLQDWESPVSSAWNTVGVQQITLLPRPYCLQAHHPPHLYSLAPIRQVQPHDSVMRLQKGCVGSQVGWGPRVRLDIDSPLSRIQVKGLQGPALTQQLDFIHYLCSSIVPAMGGE